MKRLKSAFKVIVIILLVPILFVAFLGVIQGLTQISYHMDPQKAIESYRNEPPLCFIYYSAPSGLEDVSEILDEYALDENTTVFTVKSAVDGLENETAVSFCKTKEFFGRKWYSAANARLILSENRDIISCNNKTYEFYKIRNTGTDKIDENNIHYFLSASNDEKVAMKLID